MVSVTGLVTAVDPAVCAWVDVGTATTPAWATTGDYEVTATYRGITSQPFFVAVASAAGPSGPLLPMVNAAPRQPNNWKLPTTTSEWSSGMTMRLRILIVLTVALGQMFWTSCGHYSCSDTFSPNNCSTGGGGGGGIGTGGGGGGGSAASAFAFVVDQTLGSIDGYTLNATNSTFQATSNYIAPTIPIGDPGVGVVVAQKQFLYAVFAPENLIYGWSISSSGTLTTLTGFPVSVPLTGTVPIAPYHQVSVITNPSGTLLCRAGAAQPDSGFPGQRYRRTHGGSAGFDRRGLADQPGHGRPW